MSEVLVQLQHLVFVPARLSIAVCPPVCDVGCAQCMPGTRASGLIAYRVGPLGRSVNDPGQAKGPCRGTQGSPWFLVGGHNHILI